MSARPVMTVGPCPDCGVAMDYGDLHPADSDEVLCDTCAGCTTTADERAARDVAIAVWSAIPPMLDGSDDGRPFEDGATIDVFDHGGGYLLRMSSLRSFTVWLRVTWRDGARETFVWDSLYPDCLEVPAVCGARWQRPPQCAVVTDPDPDLVALLRAGADGGEGEYDRFLPPWCVRACEDIGATYEPALDEDGAVHWSILG